MNIIITGASRGFGKAIAERFAANGYNLYLSSRNEVGLYKAMEDLATRFPEVSIKAKPFDLSHKAQVKDFANWLLGMHISIDILVNNAGSFEPGSVYNEPEGTMENMMAVNFFSAYHLTRALIPAMMTQQSGHVFNMCSIASFQAYKNGGAYSISKFALAGFSKNLREEMKPHGIKVTAVYPGAAYTDSWAGSGIDPKRIMVADDVAGMIYAAAQLSPQACVEDIVLRPQLGDL
ncbi:SDR family oxidoreductase [Agriterribacter sp.]|uniref:SDR family NAD(P)-dependent oxidoreductase n=1 Tax=Agriterribacter sp. TaxID=2821509 RepID=UPI002C7D174C|nr:SDR family oxidoreductase [Agriterribacter sp.]HRO48383.1 SDR family oxidoreductase [Agriterribacter sp.]HRQ19259.1 SDR family oxidoreductase [Agriterribacter sp.]